MATYLRLSNQNIEILDPTNFRLAKAGVHVFTTFVSHLLDNELALLRPDLHIQRIINGSNILGLNSSLGRSKLDSGKLGIGKLNNGEFKNEEYLGWFKNSLKEIIINDYKKHTSRQKIRIILRDADNIEIYIEPFINTWNESIKLRTVSACRPLAEIKHTDFNVSIKARKLAEGSGADEALLVDENNLVLEGAWSNIFWFNQDHQLCTTETKILPGITRQILIELFEVCFSKISIADLKNCPGVFITQSTTGISPVCEIDGKKINFGINTDKVKTGFNNYLKTKLTPINQL